MATTFARCRLQVWFVRVSTSILLWTCLIQFHPHLLEKWPPCFRRQDIRDPFTSSNRIAIVYPPARVYKTNGYLMVSCNGGLNQMRAAICDMVTIARYLNLTMVVPDLDKASFWADSRYAHTKRTGKQLGSSVVSCLLSSLCLTVSFILICFLHFFSEFWDIFDVKHFITSLRDEVRIIKELPKKLNRKVQSKLFSMPPISWANKQYYLKQILPLIRKHKVVHFNKTDARLANNGLPLELQKLRCRVNYNALKFTPRIEEMGQRLVNILQRNGFFVVLHLRYEMDMLAFSGCTKGCTEAEADELTKMRYAYPWWKEKVILSKQKRLEGLCPLTPEETALVLKALGFDKNTQIYIAAGEIYGGERRMEALRAAYNNIVQKDKLLSPNDLKPFQNHSSQMAALDYLVSIASDVFIPTYDGNMAKLVEGHRRYLGFRKTVLLNRKRLVELLDMHENGSLRWDEFAVAVRKVHKNCMGEPTQRKVVSDRPKEEGYFYANPQECLHDVPSKSSVSFE